MKTQIYSLFFSAASFSGIFAQNIITVDNNSNSSADYADLQTAVNAAADGDYIYIYPSEAMYAYNGTVNIINKKLHFRGIAHHLQASSTINANINSITFMVGSSGSSVTGLRVRAINTNSASSVNNIVIQNNWIGSLSAGSYNHDNWIIEGNIFNGSLSSDNVTNNNWHIINNFFDSTFNGGYILHYLSSDTVLRNNIFKLNSYNGLYYNCKNTAQNNIFLVNTTSAFSLASTDSPSASHTKSLTYNYGTGGSVVALEGSNNYNNTNPSFATAPSPLNGFSVADDYHVTNSTLVGTDGTQIGIFGQNFPFNKFGYSFQMPYVEQLEILNTSVPASGTLQVNVTAKSN